MKRYIKASVSSIGNMSGDELNDIISEPNTSPDLLRSIIADIPEHPNKYNNDSIVNLIKHPNLTESDIPKEWAADSFYQKQLLVCEDAPAWFLLKIYNKNPRYLYDSYDSNEPNIYMYDLVRHPNLPECARQDIVQRFPYMFEGATVFNFSLSSANILSEDEYPFNATEQYIEDIIRGVIASHAELLNSDKCDVAFDTNLYTILSIDVFVPMIIVKQTTELIGNAIQEALSAEGYQVDDWSYDET